MKVVTKILPCQKAVDSSTVESANKWLQMESNPAEKISDLQLNTAIGMDFRKIIFRGKYFVE